MRVFLSLQEIPVDQAAVCVVRGTVDCVRRQRAWRYSHSSTVPPASGTTLSYPGEG